MGMYNNNEIIVTVKREELLAKLKENREKHVAEHARMVAARATAIVVDLRKALAVAEAGGDIADMTLSWPLHDNMVESYDTAIAMLQMAVNVEMNISREQFEQFVLDRWPWKRNYTATNAGYLPG